MRVYRVENDNGNGPYWGFRGNIEDSVILHQHGLSAHTPDPHDPEEPWHRSRSYGVKSESFGFASIQAAQSWFDLKEVREVLLRNDLRLYEYEVEEDTVTKGKHQLTFRKSTAKRLWCVAW
jgi:hypothetical protein